MLLPRDELAGAGLSDISVDRQTSAKNPPLRIQNSFGQPESTQHYVLSTPQEAF